MALERTPNTKLAGLLAEAGWSHSQAAAAFVRVAAEMNAREFATVGRSHVSHWVAGSKPSGDGTAILCEALSRRLARIVTPTEIDLAAGQAVVEARDWHADTLTALTELGRADLDMERRRVLTAAAYAASALALPAESWWRTMAAHSSQRATAGRQVGQADVDAVRDMAAMFSRMDQRRGGGHARTAVVQYLSADVASFLGGTYRDDHVRRDMFSAASELAYVSGWMAFDNGEHAVAQQYFTTAVKLAAEADDAPLAGHVLRAMAHQAVDLGHPKQALSLAQASVDGRRYTAAAPREKALLGVVHARALAAAGKTKAAAAALLRAEDDLAAAGPGGDEPSRVFFFSEASLAHETACTLRDIGDLDASVKQFRLSVRKRQATTFTRTHAVTLGYLGAVQARQGSVEEACATWSRALDAMDGIRSARTRQVATDIRTTLSPFRHRAIAAVAEVDTRAATYLAAV